jgi:hypothetical protein
VIWWIVVALLVVVVALGWWRERRRRASHDPTAAYRFNPSDPRDHVVTHDVMRDSYRSIMRKDPGSGN